MKRKSIDLAPKVIKISVPKNFKSPKQLMKKCKNKIEDFFHQRFGRYYQIKTLYLGDKNNNVNIFAHEKTCEKICKHFKGKISAQSTEWVELKNVSIEEIEAFLG